jgi:hypothetical protein
MRERRQFRKGRSGMNDLPVVLADVRTKAGPLSSDNITREGVNFFRLDIDFFRLDSVLKIADEQSKDNVAR